MVDFPIPPLCPATAIIDTACTIQELRADGTGPRLRHRQWAGAAMRNLMSFTVYTTLPGDAAAGGIVPLRTRSKAVARRVSTVGGATGTLCAPSTNLTPGARAASRRI